MMDQEMTDQERIEEIKINVVGLAWSHPWAIGISNDVTWLISQLTKKDKQLEERTEALDWMSRAFDPERPDKCHQDCFNASDGHGYEMQDIALSKCRQALKDWKEKGRSSVNQKRLSGFDLKRKR